MAVRAVPKLSFRERRRRDRQTFFLRRYCAIATGIAGRGTIMAAFIIFRCPYTDMDVQTSMSKQESDDARTYEAVTCAACTRIHFYQHGHRHSDRREQVGASREHAALCRDTLKNLAFLATTYSIGTLSDFDIPPRRNARHALKTSQEATNRVSRNDDLCLFTTSNSKSVNN
jgi:hypothetical protein